MGHQIPLQVSLSEQVAQLPLFDRFPELGKQLSHVSLGIFPTPIEHLANLGKEVGIAQLYVKRDDLSGLPYGGNKVRKLEFILGDIQHRGAKEVITCGFAGSNHALATTIYARRLGLRSIELLKKQPNAHYVRHKLLMSMHYGAELHHYNSLVGLLFGLGFQVLRHGIINGKLPSFIPAGGSSPLGVVGYVNAAYELANQVERGDIPEPDFIYLPAGTMGTAVGLMLGLKAAGLKSRVIAVRILDRRYTNEKRMLQMFIQTNTLLRTFDSSFPQCNLSLEEIELQHQFFGNGYARFTEEGVDAMNLIRRLEGITLDGTYTGKALAGLVAGARHKGNHDPVVLFWNTYNSRRFHQLSEGLDYRQLSRPFHRYFESDVQPLDRPAE